VGDFHTSVRLLFRPEVELTVLRYQFQDGGLLGLTMRGVTVLGDSSSYLSSECCQRSAGRVLSPLVVSVSWQPVVDDVTDCCW